MYNRKNEGPGMEPRGTLALTGYTCKNSPSGFIWSWIWLRKDKIPYWKLQKGHISGGNQKAYFQGFQTQTTEWRLTG